MTAAVAAGGAALVFDLPASSSLLIGAVVASTDAAAVFSALRGQAMPGPSSGPASDGIRSQRSHRSDAHDRNGRGVARATGRGRLGGSSDCCTSSAGWPSAWRSGWARVSRCGGCSSPAPRRIQCWPWRLPVCRTGWRPSSGSSGFLAVYLTGLVLGRKRRLVRSLLHFHEGLAAAAEAVLFLMLGLLVFPSRLIDVLGPALVVALVLMFVARPIAVALCLPWFRFNRRELAAGVVGRFARRRADRARHHAADRRSPGRLVGVRRRLRRRSRIADHPGRHASGSLVKRLGFRRRGLRRPRRRRRSRHARRRSHRVATDGKVTVVGTRLARSRTAERRPCCSRRSRRRRHLSRTATWS